MAWTEERRKRQAAICQQTQPWLHSTGPKTLEGKAVVALNACKYKGPWHEELIKKRRSLFERQKAKLRLLLWENRELRTRLRQYEPDAHRE